MLLVIKINGKRHPETHDDNFNGEGKRLTEAHIVHIDGLPYANVDQLLLIAGDT